MFIIEFLRELPSPVFVFLFLIFALLIFMAFGRVIHIKAGGVELKSLPSGQYVSFSAHRFSFFSILMLLLTFGFSTMMVNKLCATKHRFLERGQIFDAATDTLIVGATVYVEGGASAESDEEGMFELRIESTVPKYSWLGCRGCEHSGEYHLKILYDGQESSYQLRKPLANTQGGIRKEFLFPNTAN